MFTVHLCRLWNMAVPTTVMVIASANGASANDVNIITGITTTIVDTYPIAANGSAKCSANRPRFAER